VSTLEYLLSEVVMTARVKAVERVEATLGRPKASAAPIEDVVAGASAQHLIRGPRVVDTPPDIRHATCMLQATGNKHMSYVLADYVGGIAAGSELLRHKLKFLI
jgi:hypothetical protein